MDLRQNVKDKRQVRDGFASELRKNYDSNQTSEEQL